MSNSALDLVLAEVSAAWQTGDGTRLAAVFAVDATMVDVRGRILRGREDIAREHRELFETIFRGASFAIELLDSRPLGDGFILAHTSSEVVIPAGPRAGRNRGVQTMLLSAGEVVAFHNTSCSG